MSKTQIKLLPFDDSTISAKFSGFKKQKYDQKLHHDAVPFNAPYPPAEVKSPAKAEAAQLKQDINAIFNSINPYYTLIQEKQIPDKTIVKYLLIAQTNLDALYQWNIQITIDYQKLSILSIATLYYSNGIDPVIVNNQQYRNLIAKLFLKLNHAKETGTAVISPSNGQIHVKFKSYLANATKKNISSQNSTKFLATCIKNIVNGSQSRLKHISVHVLGALQQSRHQGVHEKKLLAELADLDRAHHPAQDADDALKAYQEYDATYKQLQEKLKAGGRDFREDSPEYVELRKKYPRIVQPNLNDALKQLGAKVIQDITSFQPTIKYDKAAFESNHTKCRIEAKIQGQNFKKYGIAKQRPTENPQRFDHEINILKKMTNQENVYLMRHYYAQQRNVALDLITDQLTNYKALDTYMQQFSLTISPTTKVFLLMQIANALSSLHAQKIAHCDIKPAKILIGRLLQVKIIDFGQAVYNNEPIQHKEVAVSLPYASPETIALKLSESCDIFSLGVIANAYLFDDQPFDVRKHSQKFKDQLEKNTYRFSRKLIIDESETSKYLFLHPIPQPTSSLLKLLIMKAMDDANQRPSSDLVSLIFQFALESLENLIKA